jgi:outer membrane protein TolC
MKYECSLFLVWIGLFGLISGCHPDLSKTVEQTDADVYRIIDTTWSDSLGGPSNFRLDDSVDDAGGIALAVDIPASRILTLPQTVALATARNRFYAREKELLYLTALDQIDIRHLYEPIPFAGGQSTYFKDTDVSGTETYATFGLNQLLATGAQIGGDISLGWVDILSGDFRSGFSTVATAVVTQPLLRGAGRRVVLENLTQAQRNTLYQVRTFNRYRKEFVTSIISDYYLILQLNDRHINARSHYYALAEMYGNLHKRAAAGKLPLHELNQADQDRLEALSDYIQARKDYKEALDAFKTRLSIPPNVELALDMEELNALKRSIPNPFQIAEEEALRVSREQRLDLLNAADQVDDAKRKVEVAADAIRAELNLIGAADSRTLDSRTTQERYQLSLQLDLPIDRLTEKNAYRRSLINLTEQQRAYEEAVDAMILQVRTAYRRTEEARQRYEIERESYELANLRSKNTLLLLQYERANTRDVLDAQEDLLDAKNAMTKAVIDYAIAGLEFFRDTGTMKIKPDGMWEHTINFQVDAGQ